MLSLTRHVATSISKNELFLIATVACSAEHKAPTLSAGTSTFGMILSFSSLVVEINDIEV
jgi:hypothetical protein